MIDTEKTAVIRFAGLDLNAFGLYCAIGAACALLAAAILCRSRNLKKGTAPLLGLMSLLCGLFCSRLAFSVLNMESGSWKPFQLFFGPLDGGWSLFGMIFGAFLGAWITARITGEKAPVLLDITACALPLAITAERMGESWFEGFDISRVLPDGFPDSFLTIQDAEYGVSFVATYRLAAFLSMVLFAYLLLSVTAAKRRDGATWIRFLLLCGSGGIVLESLRYDHFMEYSFVCFQQVMAAVLLVWGIILAVKRFGKVNGTLAKAAWIALIPAVIGSIAIEFALDQTKVSHIILYIIMIALLACPVVPGLLLAERDEKR